MKQDWRRGALGLLGLGLGGERGHRHVSGRSRRLRPSPPMMSSLRPHRYCQQPIKLHSGSSFRCARCASGGSCAAKGSWTGFRSSSSGRDGWIPAASRPLLLCSGSCWLAGFCLLLSSPPFPGCGVLKVRPYIRKSSTPSRIPEMLIPSPAGRLTYPGAFRPLAEEARTVQK